MITVNEKDRHDEALRVLKKFHGQRGERFIQREYLDISSQITFEKQQKGRGALLELVSKQNIRRTGTAMFILAFCQFSGSGAIQNYQTIMYGSLGFHGRTVLLVSGCYGFLGPAGQAMNFWLVADKWPRTRTLCKYSIRLLFLERVISHHQHVWELTLSVLLY